MIRKVELIDSSDICEIYNYYINNTIITFEEEPVTNEEMEKRIKDVSKELPWFVYEEAGKVLGYAYATKWKTRSGYRYSVELSVYINKDFSNRGIGSQLYKYLIDSLKEKEIHTLIGGVALPNDKSVKLHEKLGFEKVAHFKEVGYKFNTWIDVGYWQYNPTV